MEAEALSGVLSRLDLLDIVFLVFLCLKMKFSLKLRLMKKFFYFYQKNFYEINNNFRKIFFLNHTNLTSNFGPIIFPLIYYFLFFKKKNA